MPEAMPLVRSKCYTDLEPLRRTVTDADSPKILSRELFLTEIAKADLKKLAPEALIEGFVTEAKLSDPDTSATVAELDEHGAAWRAFAAEIIARGGSASLVQLLDLPDNWVAQCAGRALMVHAETKDRSLAALDRIAEERSGSASASAERARNMARYGDPLGDPEEVEKRLAEIRARDGAK